MKLRIFRFCYYTPQKQSSFYNNFHPCLEKAKSRTCRKLLREAASQAILKLFLIPFDPFVGHSTPGPSPGTIKSWILIYHANTSAAKR